MMSDPCDMWYLTDVMCDACLTHVMYGVCLTDVCICLTNVICSVFLTDVKHGACLTDEMCDVHLTDICVWCLADVTCQSKASEHVGITRDTSGVVGSRLA